MTTPEDPFATPTPNADVPVYGAPPVYASAAAAPPPQYGAPMPPGYPPTQKRNGMGVAALVLGILGVFPLTLLFISGLLAVIFGFIGRARAKRGEASNGGVALAGIILGFLGLAIATTFWSVGIYEYNTPAGKQARACAMAAQDRGDTVAENKCYSDWIDGIFGIHPKD